MALLWVDAANAGSPYINRFNQSNVDPQLWKDQSGKDKDFAQYVLDARAAIDQFHHQLPEGAPGPDEHLAIAIGPKEWPVLGENCTPFNTDGIVLVHGLTDSPYLMRGLGDKLAAQSLAPGRCLRVRSLLLPGHGTRPGDLLKVTYEQWTDAAGYGLRSFNGVAARVHFVGFSTGGALGVYWAYHQAELPPQVSLASLVLLSPALRPKPFVTRLNLLPHIYAGFVNTSGVGAWSDEHLDQDFAKYESFPLNAGYQVYRLDETLEALLERAPIPVPVYMALSRNDATVNAADSILAFARTADPRNRMLLTVPEGRASADTAVKSVLADNRVSVVEAVLPDMAIIDIAHTAFPIAPHDLHYGAGGRYANCLRHAKQPKDASPAFCACITKQMRAAQCDAPVLASKVIYGEAAQSLPADTTLRRLTFNPYFDRMVGEIQGFLASVTAR